PFRAGDTDAAEERRRQALSAGPPLGAAYALLAEATRLKLPRPIKQRCEQEFAAALAAPPTGAAAVALAGALLDQQRQGGTYIGQKTHARKIQTYVEAALAADPGEADLIRLCEHLNLLD